MTYFQRFFEANVEIFGSQYDCQISKNTCVHRVAPSRGPREARNPIYPEGHSEPCEESYVSESLEEKQSLSIVNGTAILLDHATEKMLKIIEKMISPVA